MPAAWEDFLPGYAAILENYENGIEIMEQVPDIDMVVVPVGGAGLIAGVR